MQSTSLIFPRCFVKRPQQKDALLDALCVMRTLTPSHPFLLLFFSPSAHGVSKDGKEKSRQTSGRRARRFQ
jgi:hypothetical protein